MHRAVSHGLVRPYSSCTSYATAVLEYCIRAGLWKVYSRVFGKIHVFQRFCTCISACAPSTVLRVASRPARPLYMYKILYMHGIRSASSGMSIRYLRVEYDSTRYFLCCCATRLSVFEFRCGTFTDPLQQPLLLKLRSLYLVKVYIYEIDMHV